LEEKEEEIEEVLKLDLAAQVYDGMMAKIFLVPPEERRFFQEKPKGSDPSEQIVPMDYTGFTRFLAAKLAAKR
jgi:hypothetical protein